MMRKTTVTPVLCTFQTAADTLGVDKTEITRLANAGYLTRAGRGQSQRIVIDSIRGFQDSNGGLMPKGYVYLIQSGIYFKIGLSRDVHRRLVALRAAFPEPVHLIHTIKTNHMAKAENHLHRMFADRRIQGEWFKLSDEDVSVIRSYEALFM